jgi:hypothetical protein
MELLKYYTKTIFINYIYAFFASLGLVWMVFEAYMSFTGKTSVVTYWQYISISLVFGLIWVFIDGCFKAGYLRQTITIQSNGFDTKVVVKFGDIFKQDGWKAIAVNDFFDSKVDEKHIASKTLHGHTLNTYWGANINDWDNQITSELSRISGKMVERTSGNSIQYPIGTTASISKDGVKMLFVALTHTDIDNLLTTADTVDLNRAIRGLLQKARIACANEPLNIPLMGSGLSRIGIKNNILVDLILTAIFEETKQSKITNEIRIILPSEKINEISLHHIQKDWS